MTGIRGHGSEAEVAERSDCKGVLRVILHTLNTTPPSFLLSFRFLVIKPPYYLRLGLGTLLIMIT